MSEGMQSSKVCQLLCHGHAIGVRQSLSRAYFNFLSLSVTARWIRKEIIFFWGGGVSSHPLGRQNPDKEELFSFL